MTLRLYDYVEEGWLECPKGRAEQRSPVRRCASGGDQQISPPPLQSCLPFSLSADVAGDRQPTRLENTGRFPVGISKLLRDAEATRTKVMSALKQVLAGARPHENGVYLHRRPRRESTTGSISSSPYDTDAKSLAKTGVPLAQIKDLFDQSPSHQVFPLARLFCHSGGHLGPERPIDRRPGHHQPNPERRPRQKARSFSPLVPKVNPPTKTRQSATVCSPMPLLRGFAW